LEIILCAYVHASVQVPSLTLAKFQHGVIGVIG
jgi:hypothetical protein